MSAAERAWRLLGHLRHDPESDALLLGLVRALTSELERASLVAHGDATLRPWQAITDPVAAPAWALPYAALWTGGRMPRRLPGESEADYIARARHAVIYPRGIRRGSAAIALEAARRHLTGQRRVEFRERWEDDPWSLLVVTYAAETPDPGAVGAAIREVLPAGIVLTHNVLDGQDWQSVSEIGTWGEVRDEYESWGELRADIPEEE